MFCLFTLPQNREGVIFSLQFVCVSECLSGSACEQNSAKRMNWFGRGFRWVLLTALAQSLIRLVNLGQRSRSQWRNTNFFLYNSVLTSLFCISALLCSIKIKFGMWLRYTLCRFVFKFHEIRMGDDVIMTSFKFSPNNCPYLKFYWTYKLRTWNQYTTI